MNEQLNVWERGLEVVRKLDKKSPVKSFRLTEMNHAEYSEKAETDANVKTNVLQHKALIGAWTKNIAKSMKRNPKQERALRKLVLEAHGKVPLFNYRELEGYEIPPKAAKNFVKAIGDKGRTLTILKVFNRVWLKTVYMKADSDFRGNLDHPKHLAYHAATIYFQILRKAIRQLEEKS